MRPTIPFYELPPKIYVLAQENVSDFTHFQWVHEMNIFKESIYIFSTPRSQWPLMYTNKDKMHLSPRAKIYGILDYVKGDSTEVVFSKLRNTKTVLESSLQETWNNETQAELYIDLAIQNQVRISEIMNCSPLILNCFNGGGIVEKLNREYQQFKFDYVIGLTRITNDKVELLNMLNNLPPEVIEAMI